MNKIEWDEIDIGEEFCFFGYEPFVVYTQANLKYRQKEWIICKKLKPTCETFNILILNKNHRVTHLFSDCGKLFKFDEIAKSTIL